MVKVHKEYLAAQRLPSRHAGKGIWKERYADIRGMEDYLVRNGTLVLKFFLNVSKDEQKKRFLERIDEPEKHWKFAAADVAQRGHWKEYMDAYQDMIRATAAPHAPGTSCLPTTNGIRARSWRPPLSRGSPRSSCITRSRCREARRTGQGEVGPGCWKD